MLEISSQDPLALKATRGLWVCVWRGAACLWHDLLACAELELRESCAGRTEPENMSRPKLFVAASRMEASAEELFRWHAEPGALERLTPPWERVEMIERAAGIRDGDRGAMWVYMGPLRLRWTFEHSGYIERRRFRDVQTSGPFRRWEHTHLFIPEGPEACRLEDRIEYELPLGALGDFAAGWMVRRKLARVFEYRHRVTAEAMRMRREGHPLE